MVPRVPDEYFRKRASESDDVREDQARDATDDQRPKPDDVAQPARDGIAPRLLVLILVAALAGAYILGRLVIFTPRAPDIPTISPSAAPTAPMSEGLAPYDGRVGAVKAHEALGECREGGQRDSPEALIDDDPDTIWRCHGNGVGESITFTFDPSVSLAGVRLVNGNTVWTGRYAAERRLLSVQWRFADGSYFVQGLAANNRGFQEIRFPQVTTGSVTMTVELATEPGDSADMVDAVSISSLEFLVPG
ncbi:discoidin domain-containing protein [Tessaracoccus aquimaris]|uniref:discoidin domain-containing protein n=1 Tax=Tessaracoccus aquimaris TaxID=1332264 RepID=UPI0011AB515A|nr:discoidin domain-containing protein [Tessaracoccus aquimaris]